MGHSYEYEHLQPEETVIGKPTRIVVSGEPWTREQGMAPVRLDIEALPWPSLPYDFEALAQPKPSRLRRLLDTIRMSW